MSELAILTNQSLSRLSHLVKRLEGRGLVRREPDAADGRFTNAILTDEGCANLVASAPAHVETVRALVIDAFNAAELQQLREAFGTHPRPDRRPAEITATRQLSRHVGQMTLAIRGEQAR